MRRSSKELSPWLSLMLQVGVALVNTFMHQCLSSELNSLNCFAFLVFSSRLTNCVRAFTSVSQLNLKHEPFIRRITGTGFQPTWHAPNFVLPHTTRRPPPSFRELDGKQLSQSLSRSKCHSGQLYYTLFCYIVLILRLRLCES